MYPSKPNANAAGSNQDSDPSKFTAPSSASGEKHGPSMDSGFLSSNPSAPLLPFGPFNLPPPDMEPPSYSSVVAQDSSDWNNPSSSFSGPNNRPPYPPGPSPTPGPTNQPPYPTGGLSSYGPPAQAPYPTGPSSGPQLAGNAPYPTGPGLGSGIPSQPPYSTGSGSILGPESQFPYPITSMPMPAPVGADRQIGFTAPNTTEPKSANLGYPPGGYGQGPVGMQTAPYPIDDNQQGLLHTTSPVAGSTNQPPYPTGGLSLFGPPAQAPYPTGPGLGSGITSQPPYHTGPGHMPGPASQAPYPIAAMPMPAPVDANGQIGFTAPVTTETKSANPGYPPGGYGQGSVGMQTIPHPMNGDQQGLIHSTSAQETRRNLFVFYMVMFAVFAIVISIGIVINTKSNTI